MAPNLKILEASSKEMKECAFSQASEPSPALPYVCVTLTGSLMPSPVENQTTLGIPSQKLEKQLKLFVAGRQSGVGFRAAFTNYKA